MSFHECIPTLSNDVRLDIDERDDATVVLSQPLQTNSVIFHLWSFKDPLRWYMYLFSIWYVFTILCFHLQHYHFSGHLEIMILSRLCRLSINSQVTLIKYKKLYENFCNLLWVRFSLFFHFVLKNVYLLGVYAVFCFFSPKTYRVYFCCQREPKQALKQCLFISLEVKISQQQQTPFLNMSQVVHYWHERLKTRQWWKKYSEPFLK